MELRGALALVTGGGQRIGRAITLALAEAGADVVIHYFASAHAAEQTAEEARGYGVEAHTLPADLADPIAAHTLIARIVAEVGIPSILINNAAIFEADSLSTASLDSWDRHQAVNVRAPLLLTQGLARVLAGSPGKVINLLDWRASQPDPRHLSYSASKATLLTLTRLAARDLAPTIQVNALALGAILPPKGQSETAIAESLRDLPVPRLAHLSEVIAPLLLLLRDDFLTGVVLPVDGGKSLTVP